MSRVWPQKPLTAATVQAAATDNRAHEDRHLRARAKKDSRPVPIPPHFVQVLRQHVERYGTASDGRLFRTNRSGVLQETGYGELWARTPP